MSMMTELIEEFNALKMRGHEPRVYHLDHEDFWRLEQECKAIAPKIDDSSGPVTLVMFYGVQVVNKG